MKFDKDSEYILNIRKPIGWTSNDVVRWVKRRSEGKVGHAGTLDPFADGVLLVCVGSATKKASELMMLEKKYHAVIEFGIITDTLDIAGQIVDRKESSVNFESIKNVLPSFIGHIEQTPPIYSALRVNGKRAYDLARSGKVVEMEKRKVQIYSINIIHFNGRTLEIDVSCSKGVYIRSLARDIAQECGTVGFLRKLTRTRIGHYSVENSLSVAYTN
jgi:tRNA pseudouridine55 synthase